MVLVVVVTKTVVVVIVEQCRRRRRHPGIRCSNVAILSKSCEEERTLRG